MMYRRLCQRQGFTLIELMIVVVIIGILASLAIPRFMTASTKTKQSEAKLILKQIYVSQRAYRQQVDAGYFVTDEVLSRDNTDAFAEIWVDVMPPAIYSYRLTSANVFSEFQAWAEANIDDDDLPDVWTINELGDLVNICNDITDVDLRGGAEG